MTCYEGQISTYLQSRFRLLGLSEAFCFFFVEPINIELFLWLFFCNKNQLSNIKPEAFLYFSADKQQLKKVVKHPKPFFGVVNLRKEFRTMPLIGKPLQLTVTKYFAVFVLAKHWPFVLLTIQAPSTRQFECEGLRLGNKRSVIK